MLSRLLKHSRMGHGKPWNERIKQFAPSWFTASMGVGVQVSLLHFFPYPGRHQHVLDGFAAALLVIDIWLFLFMVALTIARYVKFPEQWKVMIHDPIQSLFIGCCPIALGTLVSGLVLIPYDVYHIGGTSFLYFIWGLWWLDVGLALTCDLGMFYYMVTKITYEDASPSAVWLLPILPTLVSGNVGTTVATALLPISPHYSLLTTIMSVGLMFMGLSMSSCVMVLYVRRLIMFGFPPTRLAVSIFIPLSPLAQCGYGFLAVSDLLPQLLPGATSPEDYLAQPGVASALAAMSFLLGVILWVFGVWFLIPATIQLSHYSHNPFSIPWWGLIFPTGVYSLLTIRLAAKLNSTVIRILGTVYLVSVFILFTAISLRTIIKLGLEAFDYSPADEEAPFLLPVTLSFGKSRQGSRSNSRMQSRVNSMHLDHHQHALQLEGKLVSVGGRVVRERVGSSDSAVAELTLVGKDAKALAHAVQSEATRSSP